MTTEIKVDPRDYLILICDDEESIRSMLGEAVSQWGFQVATAPNGEAAYEYLQQGNLPHVILTDIRMGGMTGIDLAEKAKQLSSEVEVVIMTSHGTFETAVQAMRIGVFDYISKPFDNIEDVKTTLIHVCERIYLRYYTEFLLNEVQRKNEEISKLAKMTQDLSENLDLAKSVEIGVRGISEAFEFAPVFFIQYLQNQKSLMMTTRSPSKLFGDTQVKFLIPAPHEQSPDSVIEYLGALEKDAEFNALLEQSWKMNPENLEVRGVDLTVDNGWKIFPLITRGVPRGSIALLTNEWSQEKEDLMHRYLGAVATAFENSLLHAKVLQNAIRDSLTGLYNVRHFKERFLAEIQTCTRLEHPVSLLFFDVDHFKKYNDTHGHPAGDQVLRIVADLMKKSFRNTDFVARYGGEEFVVLMPHTAFLDALEKAEVFRKRLEDYPFPNEHTQPLGKVTVSIGVSEYPSHGRDMESVIKAADDALYEGKKKSRNVVVAGIPAEGYVPAFESKSIRTRPPESAK